RLASLIVALIATLKSQATNLAKGPCRLGFLQCGISVDSCQLDLFLSRVRDRKDFRSSALGSFIRNVNITDGTGSKRVTG
ncbi:hypothetical protein AMECASPLE_020534, partial [Ameca splendens]